MSTPPLPEKKKEILLAIVGWRNFTDYVRFSKEVMKWVAANGDQQPSLIISGGCRGADTMAERYAKENNIRTRILRPDWARHKGKAAYSQRDRCIALQCTHMLAFPSIHGSGTQVTIRFAQEFRKDVTVVDV